MKISQNDSQTTSCDKRSDESTQAQQSHEITVRRLN